VTEAQKQRNQRVASAVGRCGAHAAPTNRPSRPGAAAPDRTATPGARAGRGQAVGTSPAIRRSVTSIPLQANPIRPRAVPARPTHPIAEEPAPPSAERPRPPAERPAAPLPRPATEPAATPAGEGPPGCHQPTVAEQSFDPSAEAQQRPFEPFTPVRPEPDRADEAHQRTAQDTPHRARRPRSGPGSPAGPPARRPRRAHRSHRRVRAPRRRVGVTRGPDRTGEPRPGDAAAPRRRHLFRSAQPNPGRRPAAARPANRGGRARRRGQGNRTAGLSRTRPAMRRLSAGASWSYVTRSAPASWFPPSKIRPLVAGANWCSTAPSG